MHRLTQRVSELARDLELEQFKHPAERARINEVRALALAQVADDQPDTAGSRRDHIGRRGGPSQPGGDVTHYSSPEDGVGLWRKWAPEQIALEAGLAVFLAKRTQKQREALWLLFDRHLSERDAAKLAGIGRPALQERRDGAIQSLRKALTAAFLTEEAA